MIGVDISPERLELAKKMGTEYVFNAKETDVVKEIEELTKGDWMDIAVEVTGNKAVVNDAARTLRRGADFVLVGLFDGPVEIDLVNNVLYKEANVYGITGRVMWDSWWTAQNILVSGKMDIAPITTHYLTIEEYERAFELAESATTGKIVFQF